MRLVLAIVTFVVAAALIGIGIAERTIWASPSSVVAQTTVTGGAPFTVIDGAVLNSHPGQQTLLVSGAKQPFVAYGRTADVKAWLGDERYAKLSYKRGTNTLTSRIVTPKGGSDVFSSIMPAPGTPSTPTTSSAPAATPTPGALSAATPAPADPAGTTGTDAKRRGPNPIGSDLWLEQFVGQDAAITKMNVPDSISVIIASDGTAAAPKSVAVVWPLDNSTPWSGPFIVGGGVLLLVGLVLYLFALRGMRRARGPRRNSGGPKPPKLPRSAKYLPTDGLDPAPASRRAIRRRVVVVPIAVIGSLLFSGCSAQYWPDFGSAATPSKTATPLATDIPGQGKDALPPAVTAPQLDDIVTRISTVAAEADSKLNAGLIKTRFVGPALQERTANYIIRAKKSDAAAPQPIPAGPVIVGVPQATDTWPRVVAAVVQDKTNAKSAPIDLVMVQQTPRDNYQVEYAITLQADAKVRDLAPVTIGASLVPPDSQLLKISPNALGPAYSDVLMNGAKSKFADLFDERSDGLSSQIGAEFKVKQMSELAKTASLSYTSGKGSGDPIALATNDSGAVVATSVTETATVKVVESGARVSAGDATAALAGVTDSGTGLATTYGYQLLFYVPPADSSQQIRLLGFSQAPISAKET
ncbi:MAG: hypothetical protein EPN48_01350 [Microbacteriaceae bacterium]|nr:MAG: hypothetical protein EPN48_01350 [Microbacteriaceae bacterium]